MSLSFRDLIVEENKPFNDEEKIQSTSFFLSFFSFMYDEKLLWKERAIVLQ
jgi:hypothetical protein